MKKRVAVLVAVLVISGSTATSCENRDRQVDSVQASCVFWEQSTVRVHGANKLPKMGFQGTALMSLEACGGNNPGNVC